MILDNFCRASAQHCPKLKILTNANKKQQQSTNLTTALLWVRQSVTVARIVARLLNIY